MATRYWTNGAGTGVVSTASNWSPSGAPSAGDTLIFASSPTGATSTAVVGGDYSALGDMAEVRIGSDFTAAFGSSSAYVQILSSATVLEATGNVFIDIEGAVSGDTVTINNTNVGPDAIHLRGDMDIVRILNSAGDISIEATTANSTSSGYTEVDNLYVFTPSRGKISTEINVSSLDVLHIDSGVVASSCACVTASLYGGEFTQESTGTITTLNVYGDQTTVLLNGSGTVTTLNQYAGTTTFQNNASDGLTVTNCTLYAGTIDLSPSMRNVTFTNDIINKGGSLIPPLASTISVAY